MTTELKTKIDALKKSRSEEDRKACVPLLQEYLKSNPTDARSWYDLACCFDFCGLEVEAEPCYWNTFEHGWKNLDEKNQPGFFVGFGSTLRNNLKFAESEKILKEGIQHFPKDPALKVFLAFTQHSMGNFKECAETLFLAQTQIPPEAFDGYANAINWYAQNLHTHPVKHEYL